MQTSLQRDIYYEEEEQGGGGEVACRSISDAAAELSNSGAEGLESGGYGNIGDVGPANNASSDNQYSGGSARYKLMSPAKLPISRSPCPMTIPPGLSPTSFLESPVLLSNIKAEPSPTTGAFSLSQFTQSSKMTSKSSSIGTYDETNYGNFEFQFQTGSSVASGPPISMASMGFKHQHNDPPQHGQHISLPQSLAFTSSTKSEMPFSKDFGAALNHCSSSTTAAVDSDLLNQRAHQNNGIHVSHSDNRDAISTVPSDRSPEDGFNWRKYGQKLVKGSEFPRSYYKCTYPNCEVKKIFERSPEGHITEIVYKGSHDHPKPQTNRRFTPGALMSNQEEKIDRDTGFLVQEDKYDTNAQTSNMEQSRTPVQSPQQETEDGLDASSSQLQCVNDEIDEDDPFSKRRKLDGAVDVIPVIKPIREPRVVVQTVSEVDILDDGYRWRKYGQKIVRGNPNPRSYYKCTSAGCPVRKHVERASHDHKAVITTYEGKHNHDVPTARTSSHELAGPTPISATSRIKSKGNGSVGLGMRMGNRYGAECEPIIHTSNRMVLQGSPFSACYGGVVNGGMTLEGVGGGGGGLEGTPFQPSNQCPQNIERILLGP